MTFQLILRNSSPPSASPYRLLDGQGRELAWPMPFSMPRDCANFLSAPCAPMATTCCTWPVGYTSSVTG